MAAGMEVMCRKRSIARCPQAVSQCLAGLPLPTAPRECNGELHEFHYPLPPKSDAVWSRRSTAGNPKIAKRVGTKISIAR